LHDRKIKYLTCNLNFEFGYDLDKWQISMMIMMTWPPLREDYYSVILGVLHKRSSGMRGSLGENGHGNLVVRVSKIFNPNRREIRVPE
jgi:hypothetical protein